MGRWTERAKQLQQEANHATAEGIGALELGMLVHYQIPVFERDKHSGWKQQKGLVQLIDEDYQGVVVMPLDKDETLR